MDSILFHVSAVGAGFVLLGLVVYSYVRPHPKHRPSVTALLGLLAFALIASPNWTRISIRSDGLELSLLREIEARQLEALEELEPIATPPRAVGSEPTVSNAERDAEVETDGTPEAVLPGAEGTRPSPAEQERMLDAFERGKLDLRKLSNAELLALNATLTERKHGERQD